jgi:VCBS repeat-containing protein
LTDADGNPLAEADIPTGFSIDPATGAYTFDGASYELTPDGLDLGSIYFVATDDLGATSAPAQLNLTVTGVNDAPTITTGSPAEISEGDVYTITSSDLQADDVDLADGEVLTYRLDGLPAGGDVYVNGVKVGDNGTFTQNDLDNNRVEYHHADGEDPTDLIRVVVSDEHGGKSSMATFRFNINDVNDTPELDLDATGDQQVDIAVSSSHSYDNIIGVYRLDENGNPSDPEIILTSSQDYKQDVGDLLNDTFDKGDELRFFIVSNGDGEFTATERADGIDYDNVSFFQDSNGNWKVDIDGHHGFSKQFYSDSEFNVDGVDHFKETVNDDGTITIGVEDLSGGGDRNYIDTTITITPSPDSDTGYETSFTENGDPVSIASDVAITDADSLLMSQAVIVLNIEDAKDILLLNEGDLPTGITLDTDGSGLSADGQTYTITLIGDASGTAYEQAIKLVQFHNNSDDPGSANRTIDITVTDSEGNPETSLKATTTVIVEGVNDAPVAETLDATILEDGTFSISNEVLIRDYINDVDSPDSDLTITELTIGGNPATLGTDGNWTFQPEHNDNGTFDIEYKVSDQTDESNPQTGTGTLTINAVNDAPVAVDDEFSLNTVTPGISIAVDTPMEMNTPDEIQDVLDNWESAGVTIGAYKGDALNPTWTNEGGKITFSAKQVDSDRDGDIDYSGFGIKTQNDIDGGEIDILPSGNGNAHDNMSEVMVVSFETGMDNVNIELAALFDGVVYDNGNMESARIAVYGEPLHGNKYTLLGHIDVDGSNDGLVNISLAAADFGGQITQVALMPLNNEAGQFSGNNSDFLLKSISASTLDQVDGTFLEDETITLDANTLLSTNNAVGDSDFDVDGDTLSVVSVTNPSHGTVSLVNGQVVFEPEANYHGQATFEYTISDGHGGTDTATVTLNITSVDDAPVANADTATIVEDTSSISGNVLVGDEIGGVADSSAEGWDSDGAVTPMTDIQGSYGSLTMNSDGSYTYELDNDNTDVQGINDGEALTDTFTYTVTDADGDSSTAELAITVDGRDEVQVIPGTTDNGNDTIAGGSADDVLAGDFGGAESGTVTTTLDYNYVVMMDTSGSMAYTDDDSVTRLTDMKNAVSNMLDSLQAEVDANGGTVTVRLIRFDTLVDGQRTFTLEADGNNTQAKNYVNGMHATGGTNYEDALMDALHWVENDAPAAAKTHAFFITDGKPTYYNDEEFNANNSNKVSGPGSSTSNDVLENLTGEYEHTEQVWHRGGRWGGHWEDVTTSDTKNDITALQNAVDSLRAVAIGMDADGSLDGASVTIGGIVVDTQGELMDAIDSTGSAILVNNSTDLNQTLEHIVDETLILHDAGSDNITGGAGNDTIFGDAVDTDALAQAHDLDLPEGSGWKVFETLEGTDDWTRENTLEYIKDHHQDLATELIGTDGSGRDGGHDLLSGGQGDDIIYGQEGHDQIYGGSGADLLNGGSGNDTIYGGTGDDTIYDGAGDDLIITGQCDSCIISGEGNDKIVIDESYFNDEGSTNITVQNFQDGDSLLMNDDMVDKLSSITSDDQGTRLIFSDGDASNGSEDIVVELLGVIQTDPGHLITNLSADPDMDTLIQTIINSPDNN